mgnify:CR=1 FL=1
MLSALVSLAFLAAVFCVLIVAIVFANKFAVLCLSLLTAYIATLIFLAHRRRASAEVVTHHYSALPQPQVTVWSNYDSPVIETPENPYAVRHYK